MSYNQFLHALLDIIDDYRENVITARVAGIRAGNLLERYLLDGAIE